MKKLLLLSLLATAPSFAAARYFVSGGVDNNWGTTGNWSLTDGGAGGQSVPSASDDVHFTANSPNCTVNASARSALTLDFTGYTNTITMSQQLSSAGSVTLSSGMTISGSGLLNVNATATLTSNGKTWPSSLSLPTNNATYTLADNWTVTGLVTLGASGGTATVNGFQITANGGLTVATTNANVTGTTVLILGGTGTLTGPGGTGQLRNPLTIAASAGTVTFAAGAFNYAGTLTYTSGTVVSTGSTLSLIGANSTVDISGVTWTNVLMSGAITVTLSSNISLTGLLTLGATTNNTVINGNTINASGGIRYAGTTGIISGTTILKMNATGTLDAPSGTTGRISNPITLAAGGGTITITSPVNIDVGLLTYTSGTIVANNSWTTSGGSGGQRVYSSVK